MRRPTLQCGGLAVVGALFLATIGCAPFPYPPPTPVPAELRHVAPGQVEAHVAGSTILSDQNSPERNVIGGYALGGVQLGIRPRINLGFNAGAVWTGATYSAQGSYLFLSNEHVDVSALVGLGGTVNVFHSLKFLSFAPYLGVRSEWKLHDRFSLAGLARVSRSDTVVLSRDKYPDDPKATLWLEYALATSLRVYGPLRVGIGLNAYNELDDLGKPGVAGSLSASYTFGEKTED